MYVLIETSVCRGHVISSRSVFATALDSVMLSHLNQIMDDFVFKNNQFVDVANDGKYSTDFEITQHLDGYSLIYKVIELQV